MLNLLELKKEGGAYIGMKWDNKPITSIQIRLMLKECNRAEQV